MSSLPIALNAPNGVHTPSTPNDNGALSSAADSPAVDSPVTPSSAPYTAVGINIDMDYPGQESDARHEPISVNLDKLDAASTRPQFGTPVDPGMTISLRHHMFILAARFCSMVLHVSLDSIPIAPPKGTPPPPAGQLLEDVQMAELPSPNGSVSEHVDMPMADATVNGYTNGLTPTVENLTIKTPQTHSPSPVPASAPATVEPVASSSRLPEVNGSIDDSDQPPPAKRARKLSDAEQASLAHVSLCLLRAVGRLHHDLLTFIRREVYTTDAPYYVNG